MFKPVIQTLIVVVALVALIGQVFAYTAMACEMNELPAQQQMAMEHTAMGHHDMMEHASTTMQHDVTSMTCCDTDCACPEKACSPVMVLVDAGFTSFQSYSVTTAIEHTVASPLAMSSSRYRPPILA